MSAYSSGAKKPGRVRRPSKQKVLRPEVIKIDNDRGHTPKEPKSPRPAPKQIGCSGLTASSHVFNPAEFLKHNSLRNTYDIQHIKKLIGKKIMIMSKGVLTTAKHRDDSKNIKALILTSRQQTRSNIIIHVMSTSGILQVIGGVPYFMAINNISYKDIEIHEHLKTLDIKIIQCNKLSAIDTKKLIDYLN